MWRDPVKIRRTTYTKDLSRCITTSTSTIVHISSTQLFEGMTDTQKDSNAYVKTRHGSINSMA